MLSFLKERWSAFFSGGAPRRISLSSTLAIIERTYPSLKTFLWDRYRISLEEGNTRSLSLNEFVKKHALPPAQILFMELQMQERVKNVKIISAKEAKRLLDNNPNALIFDARDHHEWDHHGKLNNAIFLTETNVFEKLHQVPESHPILCYCHYGVRSLNFASQIADMGYTNVHVIRGGIDEWSIEVDPSLPRYQGDYC